MLKTKSSSVKNPQSNLTDHSTKHFNALNTIFLSSCADFQKRNLADIFPLDYITHYCLPPLPENDYNA